MKIGILGHDFINWGGGIDFLRTVIDSLLASSRSVDVEFHLLIPNSGARLRWRAFRRAVKQAISGLILRRCTGDPSPSALFVNQSFSEFQKRIAMHRIDIGKRALLAAIDQLKLDLLIPAVHTLNSDFKLPWVGYAYDFQHKYFPSYFSSDDLNARDRHFDTLLTRAKAVIVNSMAAAADIAKFVPQAKARVFPLPFAPSPNPEWFCVSSEVLSKYKVETPFFLISNQFWIHKGYETAFDAFRIIRGNNSRISLVCTGGTADPRNPSYFSDLVTKLRQSGMETRVRILGLIPKMDQIALMRHACAVIQPTFFEGGPGGGSVYDAVSLGIPAILSNIPVNKEVVGRGISFFEVGSSQDLSEQMQIQLDSPRQVFSSEELLSDGLLRRAACGDKLWEAIDAAL